MTTTPTEWQGATLANDGNTIGFQDDPQIIGLANGDVLIVWTDSANNVDTDDGTDIIGQIYAPDGSPRGGPFVLAFTASGDNESLPVIATFPAGLPGFIPGFFPDGGFVMVFRDANDIAGGGQNTLYIRYYDNTGASSIFGEIPGASADAFDDLSVTVLADGSVVVTYVRNAGNDDIKAYIITPEAVVVPEFNVASSPNPESTTDVAALSNGNWVVAWDDDGDNRVEMRIFTKAGNLVTQVNAPGTGGDKSQPNVAGLVNGGYVVTWWEDGDVFMQIHANSGALRLAKTPVASGLAFQNEARVVALDDGSFVIVWDDDDTGDLTGQRFDADGDTIGAEFVVVTDIAATAPEISLAADGRILVTWQDTLNSNIHFAIFDPRETTILGNPLDNGLTARLEASTVIGGGGDDELYAVGEGDLLQGNAGDDTLHGGDGHDQLEGGGGDDVIEGGEGMDLARGGGGNDTINGDNGADVLRGLANNDVIEGGNGADRLEGGAGDDTLSGGDAGDVMIGGDGADVMVGGLGQDTMNGSAGDDDMEGGAGNDTMNGNAGIDMIVGGTGDDVLFGGGDADTMEGGADNDELSGGGGNDTLEGGGGDDILKGITGNDTLNGGTGDDELFGGGGGDTLNGGADDDTLRGADGADVLRGGLGADILVGGTGADTFEFVGLAESGVSPGTRDEVRDFTRGQGDKIDVSAIDANTGVGGDQAFEVVGTFTGIAGQLVITDLGGGGKLVALDVDGDSSADMTFEVMGQADLGAQDFIL